MTRAGRQLGVYSHYAPARNLGSHLSSLASGIDDDTIARFKKLFAHLNSLRAVAVEGGHFDGYFFRIRSVTAGVRNR